MGKRSFNRSKKRRVKDQQAIAEKLAEIGPTTAAEIAKQLPPRSGTNIPRTNRQVGLDLGALERMGRVEKRGYIRDGSRSGSQSWAIVPGRIYDRGGRSKRLRKIDQKRILDKVAELEVSIGTPTTAREIASALNRDNAELAASAPGSSRGITGMQGRSPTFYTTKLVAADLSVLRRQGLVSREINHQVGSAVYGRTDKAYSRKTNEKNDERAERFKKTAFWWNGGISPHEEMWGKDEEGEWIIDIYDKGSGEKTGTIKRPKTMTANEALQSVEEGGLDDEEYVLVKENCGCGMDPCRTYGDESPGVKRLKEQNAGKWSANDWRKFDDEMMELLDEVDENLLGEIDDRREFRLWKEVNDLQLIQKELETASKTHKSQSELLKAINRPYIQMETWNPTTRTYERRNSAMFTRSTGTFRQLGGKRFILDDVYGSKDQARYMAGYWRARGMNARVIPVKNGSAIYIRKKGKVQPGISSRRRGK